MLLASNVIYANIQCHCKCIGSPLNSINLEGYLSKLAQHLIFLEQLFKQKLLEIEVNH